MDNIIQRLIDRFHGRLFPSFSPERRVREVALVSSLASRSKAETKRENAAAAGSVRALALVRGTEGEAEAGDGGPTKRKSPERTGSVRNGTGLAGPGRGTIRRDVGAQREDLKRSHSVPVEGRSSAREADTDGGSDVDGVDFSPNLLGIPSMSTANLLEEIEADLPQSYSLANILDHTPHTVTNARTCERLSRVGTYFVQPDESPHKSEKKESDAWTRVRNLQRKAVMQKTLMDQAGKIVHLLKARKKRLELEDLEGIRILLLATLRYNAINLELQNVKLSRGVMKEEENAGELVITRVSVALNGLQNPEEEGAYVCVVSHREQLFASQVVSDVNNGRLHFPVNFEFEPLRQSFIVYLELYRINYFLTERKEKKKMQVVKNLMRKASRKSRNGHVKEDYFCIGTACLRLADVRRRKNGETAVDLHTNCHSCFERTMYVNLRTRVNLNNKMSGCLNLFKNWCWHSVWCCGVDYYLKCWLCPEDKDNEKPPLESLFLPRCQDVRQATMDVCIRPHSFVISNDERDLLLSASSYRDMMNWIRQLKLVIRQLETWSPDF